MRRSPGSSTFPSDQRKQSSSRRRDWSALEQAVTCGMWGNDTAMTLTWIAHTQHEHPSHQIAVRESLVCLPSFFMTTLESFLFCPQTEKQALESLNNFFRTKTSPSCYISFFTAVPERWEHSVTSLGRKFLRHLFCLWMFSVCQHEVWEEAWKGRKSNSFERPNYN